MKHNPTRILNASATTAVLAASLHLGATAFASTDYGPAIYRPMSGCSKWYTSGTRKFVVIHDMEGYYASTISYLNRCDISTSIHYMVNGIKDATSDYPAGEVDQQVREANWAWHARCWNTYSFGTEHEGFVSNPAWFTDAMYQASALLQRHLCDVYGIAKDRNHIVGHNAGQSAAWRTYAEANFGAGFDASCNTHTDPGANWDWTKFMDLINPPTSTEKVLVSRKGDFNGDGKSDIVTFLRGTGTPTSSAGNVYVALSTGTGFATSTLWSDWACAGEELPSVGDFNGDGKDDIVSFTRGTTGDVYVSLSTGSSFATSVKWSDWACAGNQVPSTGDFNGDGKTDIISWSRGGAGDAWVSLSTGSSFATSSKWADWVCAGSEIPAVGDFNGDGKDDIVSFTRGATGDVWVNLSTGSGFGASVKWCQWACAGSELPAVGDFNGDGKDDIISWNRGSSADAFVALSTGSAFGTSTKWSDWICANSDLPGVGDFNGDGKDDAVNFSRGTTADVFVSISTGSALGTSYKWSDWFCADSELPMPGSYVW